MTSSITPPPPAHGLRLPDRPHVAVIGEAAVVATLWAIPTLLWTMGLHFNTGGGTAVRDTPVGMTHALSWSLWVLCMVSFALAALHTACAVFAVLRAAADSAPTTVDAVAAHLARTNRLRGVITLVALVWPLSGLVFITVMFNGLVMG